MIKHFRTSLKRYFITGLLVIIPAWGTYLVLKTLLSVMEGVLGQILERYAVFYVPGLGIIVLILLILFAGVLATNILGRKIVKFWDDLLHRVPLVRGIYSMLKAVVDTLSLQSKDQFNKVVLIQYPRKGVYSLAFVTGVTQGEVQQVTADNLINIYVPTTPNPTSGYFLLVPENDVIPLSMTVDEGMKMVISGGLFTPPIPQGDKSTPVKSVDQPVGEHRK
jgi:uncharacterized membrane protein